MKSLQSILFLALCVSAAVTGRANELDAPMSEHDIVRTYSAILRDACRHADQYWKDSPNGAAMSYWGDGGSRGDGGIRPIAGMIAADGALLKYDSDPSDTHLSGSERRELLKKATAALRYLTATHVSGTQKCTDGRAWGAKDRSSKERWQSGLWTGSMAIGAWLMWDDLDPALKKDVERVLAWEADIVAQHEPPNGLSLDTKAEENAWQVPCVALAELMMPTHPHAGVWHDTALKYMMNTLCTASDTRDSRMVDGRAVNQWIRAANLYPDFTLENHNIFHPSYVGCSCYFLTQAMMYYTYAGRQPPDAASHHLLDTWGMFRTIILPWGEAAYPQGMDWELHGLPFINLYAALGTRFKDPFAVRMEQCTLRSFRRWQQMGGGSLTLPGSRFGFSRHAINAEQMAYGFLAHKIFGPAVEPIGAAAANAQERGVWDRPYVDFIAHRTDKNFVSFSWKNKIMGLLIPIGEGHADNPDFTVPIPNGLIGSFELSPEPSPRAHLQPTVISHTRKKTADDFESSGTLLLDGGRLRQTLTVISVGEQAVVYEDRVTAVSAVTVRGERGLPIGIENDEFTGPSRTVTSRDGSTKFERRQGGRAASIAGSWANVDDRLGVVVLAGSGIAYQPASGYSPGISVCSDILYGSFSNQERSFKAGDEVAHRVAVFFVEVSAEKTAALAQQCRLLVTPAGKVLHFKQPNGADTEVPLADTSR